MRTTHDDGYTDGANRVGHAVGLGNHASHGADADEINFLFEDVAGDSGFVHGLGISIDQHNFVRGRG